MANNLAGASAGTTDASPHVAAPRTPLVIRSIYSGTEVRTQAGPTRPSAGDADWLKGKPDEPPGTLAAGAIFCSRARRFFGRLIESDEQGGAWWWVRRCNGRWRRGVAGDRAGGTSAARARWIALSKLDWRRARTLMSPTNQPPTNQIASLMPTRRVRRIKRAIPMQDRPPSGQRLVQTRITALCPHATLSPILQQRLSLLPDVPIPHEEILLAGQCKPPAHLDDRHVEWSEGLLCCLISPRGRCDMKLGGDIHVLEALEHVLR